MSSQKSNQKLKVYVCQMTSVDDVTLNLNFILEQLNKIGKQSETTLVSFPENSLYMRLREGESIPGMQLTDAAFQVLAKTAKELQLNLHLGSVPLKAKAKLVNATVFISHKGEVFTSYEKVHLFDIQLDGGARFMESDLFEHGSGGAIVELNGWKIGLTICYDLRFSNLFHEYAEAECDLILVPAAFLVPTGKAHWDILLRARAIETQAYVVASAQAGVHTNQSGGKRETFGHSMVIDPWGTVLARGDASSAMLLEYRLDQEAVRKVRAQIPMKHHRRRFSPMRTFKVADLD